MKPARTNARSAARPKGRAGNDPLSCAISKALQVGSPINVSEQLAWQRHVIKDRKLSPLAVRVAIEMSLSFDREKQEVVRSHGYFVSIFGAARSNIQKAINEIADAGYVIIIRDKSNGAANRYSLSLPRNEGSDNEETYSISDEAEPLSEASIEPDVLENETSTPDNNIIDPLMYHSDGGDVPVVDYYKDIHPSYKMAFATFADYYPARESAHLIVNAKDFFFRLCLNGEGTEDIIDGARRYCDWTNRHQIFCTDKVIPMWRWLRDRGWEKAWDHSEAPAP